MLYGPQREKTCLEVTDQVRFKLACVAIEPSQNIEILYEAFLDILLPRKRIT